MRAARLLGALRVRRRAGDARPPRRGRRAGSSCPAASRLRGEDVRTAAQAGDAGAVAVVDEFARWVALGLVNLTNLVDPAILVLGGGLAADADLYLAADRAAGSRALLYSSEIRPRPALAFATLGEHAGAIGAALLGAGARRLSRGAQ